MKKAREKSRAIEHRSPTLEAFRALVAMHDAGGVSESARRLGVTQPVISRKLQVFTDADACGAPLLRRVAGRLVMTAKGEEVLSAIRQIVDSYDRILDYLAERVTSPSSLRIGVGSFAAEYYMPAVLEGLRDSLEQCQIETHVCRGRERILGTAREEFDMSLVSHNESQIRDALRKNHLEGSALEVTPLGEHPICLVAKKGSDAGGELARLPAKRVVPVSKLRLWELIGPDARSGLRQQLEKKHPGEKLFFIAEGGGWSASREFARRGLGVALLPLGTVSKADRKELVVRRLAREFAIPISLIAPPKASSPLHQQVRKCLIESVRQRQSDLGKDL